eukprot:TRINITY_DN4758_c0_g2_i2.p4 TRINITY_DN4758_c0_g2~~TRINITY_DN4758_c0_g2_i2.p4  ORF type:complete len:150 (+),score=13.89 TRINITY_DN4758_c0_g2_i2:2874-3323(+)
MLISKSGKGAPFRNARVCGETSKDQLYQGQSLRQVQFTNSVGTGSQPQQGKSEMDRTDGQREARPASETAGALHLGACPPGSSLAVASTSAELARHPDVQDLDSDLEDCVYRQKTSEPLPKRPRSSPMAHVQINAATAEERMAASLGIV